MEEKRFKSGEKVRIKKGIFQDRSTKLNLGEIVTVIETHTFANGEERYIVQCRGDEAFARGHYGWQDDFGRKNLQYVHGSEIEWAHPGIAKEKALSSEKLPLI